MTKRGLSRNMEHFGVHKDLASYKKVLNVFPKGRYIPENRLQAIDALITRH